MSRQILYDLIVARSLNYGIGFKGDLPWRLSQDMKMFKKITTLKENEGKNSVIMGRKTFESMNSKALPNRHNIVVSSDQTLDQRNDIQRADSFEQGLEIAKKLDPSSRIFVIGGSKLY